MTTTIENQCTEAPAVPTDDHLEPAEAAIRRDLGLRPHLYPGDGRKGSHPDQRPCPAWCWIGQHPDYDHEVHVLDTGAALHTMEGDPHVMASLYQGESSAGEGGRVVRTATIEPALEQLGQADPIIRVHLRHFEANEHHYDEILRLTLTDAEELARVLGWLVRTAEGA